MTTPAIEPVGTPGEPGPGGLLGVPGAGSSTRTPQPWDGSTTLRLRLEIAYDGAEFCGWARQPGLRSVQGELEAALRVALRIDASIPVRVAAAGRTDAGVHAVGQACHCDIPEGSWATAAGPGPRAAGRQVAGVRSGVNPEGAPGAVRRRLNGLLPADLRVRAIGVAPPGFDARWSAQWRRYSYLVADDAAGQDPRTRGHVLWHPRALDVDAMNRAAAPFIGEHDFTAYCRAREGSSSVRTIHDVGWRRVGSTAGATAPAEFSVRGDAFCHSMVRALVGAFIAVGDGRWPTERPVELLMAARRVPAIFTAPAHPLTLVEVGYPPEADLAAQAARARRWRGR